MVETINRVSRANHELLQELGHEPSPEEIAHKLHLPLEKVEEVMRIGQEPISLETPVGEEDDSHLGDFIQDDEASQPAEEASYTLLREVVSVSVVMNLLNIMGNAILINGFFGLPRMGVAGAAVSTCISKAIGLTLVIWTLRRKCTVRFSLRYLRPFPWTTCKHLLGIAMPSGMESLSYNVSQIFILRFINLMGTAVIATKVYASMLANVAYVYSIAVAQATQIILGYMIGGRKLDEVSGRVWSTIRIALAASELLTLLILIFCDPIYSIFTDDPVIHALGRQILYVEFGLEIGRSINIVMTRCLTTAGDVWYPVGVGIFSMWIVAVGGSWLLGHALNWGLVGIWIAMACDECLRGALFTIRFRSGKWKETRLVADSTKGT